MTDGQAPTAIGPAAYAAWRDTALGRITEALEQRLMLELMGPLAGRRLLDVGCGDGTLVCAAAARGAETTGADPDPAMLAAARARAGASGLTATFDEGRVERLPFPDASFDIVGCVTVLIFVADAARALREMARVLRPGGRLVLGDLGPWSWWALARRVRGWRGSATWKRAHFRSAAELRALIESAGLTVRETRGSVYYPPLGVLARLLAPADRWLGHRTTLGAAFIALSATKPGGDN